MNQDLVLSDGQYKQSDCIFRPQIQQKCGETPTAAGKNIKRDLFIETKEVPGMLSLHYIVINFQFST